MVCAYCKAMGRSVYTELYFYFHWTGSLTIIDYHRQGCKAGAQPKEPEPEMLDVDTFQSWIAAITYVSSLNPFMAVILAVILTALLVLHSSLRWQPSRKSQI